MSTNTEFVGGMIAKAPHDNAPEYVKARLSIKREELIAWLSARNDEWVNVDIKEAQSGKWYAAVDNWKPDGKRSNRSERSAPPRQQRAAPAPAPRPADDFSDDDIPF